MMMFFWLVLKLEISYNRVIIISWRILVSLIGIFFLKIIIFAWWSILNFHNSSFALRYFHKWMFCCFFFWVVVGCCKFFHFAFFLPYLNSVCFGSSLSVLGFVELASIVIWMLLPFIVDPVTELSMLIHVLTIDLHTHHSQQLTKEDAKMEISSLVAGQYKSCCCCWRFPLNMHEVPLLVLLLFSPFTPQFCFVFFVFFCGFLRFYAGVSSFCFSGLFADISDLKSL